jgi:uncharacterized membrane protein
MNPVLTIVLLWLAFGTSHIVLSSLWLRGRLVAALGEKGFLGLYSLISLAAFVPLVSFYFSHKHQGLLLWAPGLGSGGRSLMFVAMAIVFVLLVSGFLTPSPSSLSASATTDPSSQKPKGVQRLTRHAVFMGTGIFGAIHLVPNGYATDVAFFAGFPLFVLLGSVHQDRRKLHPTDSDYRAFYAATPLLPFTGRETLQGIKELDWRAVVLGLFLAFLVRHYHAAWFA